MGQCLHIRRGAAGRSLTLFVPNPESGYERQFGFPAGGWTALESKTDGWPDVSFGGPGFCHPVWAWRNGAYEFICNLPEQAGGCEGKVNICR